MDINSVRKEYRTVGLTIFLISVGLIVMRIVSYYIQVAFVDSLMETYVLELILNVLFSVPVQIGLLLVFPFLMYKLRLKKSMRDVLAFSGYRKCNIITCLLSFVIGALIIVLTLFVSVFWQLIISFFGYVPQGGASAMPDEFSLVYFIITVLITALLPAFCEEFAVRGGLLTVLRATKSKSSTIILVGVAFGLFHQNITQVFYTGLLGALLAYLVLETGSVIPAIIIHFMNNFMSVYFDTASAYGWKIGGSFFNDIEYLLSKNYFTELSAVVAAAIICVFVLVLMIKALSRISKKSDYYLEHEGAYVDSGIVLTVRDHVFYIGAIVITVVATIITYVFGLQI